MKKLVSIIIPTWNHWKDLTKECIDSIIRNTSMEILAKIEIIVVSNGSTDETQEELELLSKNYPELITGLIFKEQLGFLRSSNAGAKIANGKYLLFMNNDVVILDWGNQDEWFNRLVNPIEEDTKIGGVGPLVINDEYTNWKFIVGFCLLTPKELFEKYGRFDDEYAPAGHEEIDYCIKLQNDGYLLHQCAVTTYNGKTNVSDYPIWHKENQSYKDVPEYGNVIVKRNGLKNLIKWGKHIKLNFGAGGVEFPGYMSVDLFDSRSKILMDVTKKLEFKDNSIDEIVASHLFEHLNPYTIVDTLREWKRVLIPGGKLAMEMPHILECAKLLLNTSSKKEIYDLLFTSFYGVCNTKDDGNNANITAPHLFGWWEDGVKEQLENAGFTNIQFPSIQWPHPGANFRVEATKPIDIEKIHKSKTVVIEDWTVTAAIPTKGRYNVLSSCILGVLNQTIKPTKLIIFDDGEQKDLRQDPMFQNIFKLLDTKGIEWKVVFGKRKGMAEIDQLIVETCETHWIWRLDDDNYPEPNVLERLIEVARDDDTIGALASCAIVPKNTNSTWHKISSGDIRDIYDSPNVQWDTFDGIREVDHLHNTFLYRRKLSTHGYNTALSPVSHREETMFTWGIKKQGYKLVVVGDVITWHNQQSDGGIRSYEVSENMKRDESIFVKEMASDNVGFRQTKIMVLDTGIGDHYVFKCILSKLRQKYGRLILAVCYPEVFHDEIDITFISIQDAKNLGCNFDEANVYRWMAMNNWDKHIQQAYEAMYL